MKITVLIDKTGKVVGTAHFGIKSSSGSGDGGPVAGPGEKAQVIDLPTELEKVQDATELHRKLQRHLRK